MPVSIIFVNYLTKERKNILDSLTERKRINV